MKISFSKLHFDGTIRTRWDVLLRIVGELSIVVDRHRLYEKVEFCLVEFAVALGEWLAAASSHGPDFVYVSIESETEGLVRFTLRGPGAWEVSAAHRPDAAPAECTTEQLVQAARMYIHELRGTLLPDIDLFDYMNSEKAREAARSPT